MIRRLLAIATGVFLLAGVTMALAALPPGGSFTDDDGNVHEPSIEAIAAEAITRGCNPPVNDLYCPDATVTRGQMAAFLVRALGLTDDGGGNTFTDDDGSVFESDIAKLAAAGITKGCNPPINDLYCPDSTVTRGQMAAFLVRAMGYTDNGGGNLFVDDDGSVFENDIDRLGTAGVTRGCNPPANDRYCADDPVKRDQMASFLTRALGLEPLMPPPGFFTEIKPIDTALAARMEPSWRPGCPVPLSDLRYLLIDYWGFDGREHRGELVVRAGWASEITAVFEELFWASFPIERMVLIDDFNGDDHRSMAANNTSAFNCRVVAGTTSWSEHAYGRAIDINPVQNPYLQGSTVQPPAGVAYVDRSLDAPGMIHAGDAVVTAFDAIGWAWGGDWTNSKDWQHFSATGR
jgi:hypothetical protein